MSEITRILKDLENGDQQAASQLLPLVYEELRRLARLRPISSRAKETESRLRAALQRRFFLQFAT
jgi:hypothetical protein